MAIKPEDLTYKTPSDPSYPFGSAINSTTLISKDGTGIEKIVLDDIWGFFQKILGAGAVTPSGISDTVLASDYFTGLLKKFQETIVYVDSGAANAYQLTSVSGAVIEAYSDLKFIVFKPANNNTTASTIQIDALGTVDLRLPSGSILSADIIDSDNYTIALYNSLNTRFEVILFSNTLNITDQELRFAWFR